MLSAFEGYRLPGTHMNRRLTAREEEYVRELRWRRAAALTQGQPVQVVQPAERKRIQAIADLICEIGEERPPTRSSDADDDLRAGRA
jgi:hypothetical protein